MGGQSCKKFSLSTSVFYRQWVNRFYRSKYHATGPSDSGNIWNIIFSIIPGCFAVFTPGSGPVEGRRASQFLDETSHCVDAWSEVNFFPISVNWMGPG
jgi:hypothetical protein